MAQLVQSSVRVDGDLPPLPLPEGIKSEYIAVNDLLVHFLDAHPSTPPSDTKKPPLIVLVHGFPELAYSWRKVMRPLADLGFRVVAADQRGFGRTTPTPTGDVQYPYTYDGPLASFSFTNFARDTIALVYALGYETVACIMGHDSGSVAASSCTLVRPDIFRSVVLMSAPFMGAPDVPSNIPSASSPSEALAIVKQQQFKIAHAGLAMDALLANLNPPKMYYQHYYSLPQANKQMHADLSSDDLHDFIRAYFHIKSACWPGPSSAEARYAIPHSLKGLEDVVHLPPYYVMPRGQSMPAVVGAHLPRGDALERSRAWFSDADVAVYASEYDRTGFQGGLNRYRCATGLGRVGDSLESISASGEDHISELKLFAKKKIEIPIIFLAGEKDWGPYQYPEALAKMRSACPLMKEGTEGIDFVKEAGHWVQQENPDGLLIRLQAFLKDSNILA